EPQGGSSRVWRCSFPSSPGVTCSIAGRTMIRRPARVCTGAWWSSNGIGRSHLVVPIEIAKTNGRGDYTFGELVMAADDGDVHPKSHRAGRASLPLYVRVL